MNELVNLLLNQQQQLVWILAGLLVLVGVLTSYQSVHTSKKGDFYQDTPWLLPLGIFVWGDGLILGPFWLVSGLLFFWLPGLFIARYLLLFTAIRTGYEVVYWLTHQAAGKQYEPPLFRSVKWIDAQQSAILYQLLTTVWMFLALFGLFLL